MFVDDEDDECAETVGGGVSGGTMKKLLTDAAVHLYLLKRNLKVVKGGLGGLEKLQECVQEAMR
jgi:hypothetical protein